MTALATTQAAIMLEDLSVDELIDARRRNVDYVAWLKAERTNADKDLAEIDTMIHLRMEEKGATQFERAGFRGVYGIVKSGTASMFSAEIAMKKLAALPEVPKHALDDAFDIIPPPVEPTIKGKLREFRKLAAYSAEAAKIVASFIQEKIETTKLQIEEIAPMLNVTPKALAGTAICEDCGKSSVSLADHGVCPNCEQAHADLASEAVTA